jgi:hypothetical protein
MCLALALAGGVPLFAQALQSAQPQAKEENKSDTPKEADIEREMKRTWEHAKSVSQSQTTLHINSIKIGKTRPITREDRLDRPGLPAEGKLTDILMDFTVKTYDEDKTLVVRRVREAVVYKDQFGEWQVDTGKARGKDEVSREPAQQPKQVDKEKPTTPGEKPAEPKKGDRPETKKFQAPKLSYGKQEWDVAALEEHFIIHKCVQNNKPIPEVEFLLELKADASSALARDWTMVLKDSDGVTLLTGYLSFPVNTATWKKGDKMRVVFSRGVENAYKEQWQKATKVVVKHE